MTQDTISNYRIEKDSMGDRLINNDVYQNNGSWDPEVCRGNPCGYPWS